MRPATARLLHLPQGPSPKDKRAGWLAGRLAGGASRKRGTDRLLLFPNDACGAGGSNPVSCHVDSRFRLAFGLLHARTDGS
jgi:hypothetical protein